LEAKMAECVDEYEDEERSVKTRRGGCVRDIEYKQKRVLDASQFLQIGAP